MDKSFILGEGVLGTDPLGPLGAALDGIDLGDAGWWADRTAWSPVAHAVSHTLTGVPVVEPRAVVSSRPITLDQIIADLDTVEALKASRDTAGKICSLVLWDGAEYTVMWRLSDTAIEAEPFEPAQDPSAPDIDERYRVTLRFFEVQQ